MRPLSSVSETSSTLPGTLSPVDPDDRLARPGQRRARGRPCARAPSISPSMFSISVRRSIAWISCVATRWPSRSTVTRSQSSKTSSSRWETKMTLLPCATRSRIALNTRSISGLLSVAVGSSRMSRRASRTRRRAISTSCRSPIESDSTARPELDVAKAELVENAACVLGEAAAPVDERHVEPSEKDVVLDAQLGHEAQLLVHERDAVCLRVMWVPERDLLAVEADHAFVRLARARRAP